MSLLRGSTVTYTRFDLQDEPHWGRLDEAVKFRAFEPLGGPEDEVTERMGTCGWRNLLDGPIDHGWLPSQRAWIMGLRRDVKKAPAALLQAELARAFSDAAQAHGGGLGKEAKKNITATTKARLDRAANPKPKHALMAFLASPAIVLWDGPSAGADWVSEILQPLEPFYRGENYDKFLAWLVDHADDDSVTYALSGDATLRDAEGHGADLVGVTDFLAKYLELAHAGYTPRKLGLVLALGNENADLTLSSTGLKVQGLKFPEKNAVPNTPDEILEARIAWVAQVETELAALVTSWLKEQEPEGGEG